MDEAGVVVRSPTDDLTEPQRHGEARARARDGDVDRQEERGMVELKSAEKGPSSSQEARPHLAPADRNETGVLPQL
jgi:hypothetical protein